MSSAAQPPPVNDAFWRRPAGGEDDGPRPDRPSRPDPAPYAGPPRAAPPPPGWRPPTVVTSPDPRVMPPQDHAVLDSQERVARTVTTGTGLICGALMIVLLLVLCGRWLF